MKDDMAGIQKWWGGLLKKIGAKDELQDHIERQTQKAIAAYKECAPGEPDCEVKPWTRNWTIAYWLVIVVCLALLVVARFVVYPYYFG